MQIQLFNIPAFANEEELKKLNAFLRGNKIIDIEKQFVTNGNHSFWSILIRYLVTQQTQNTSNALKANVDYKTILDAETFEKFSMLREIRKTLAREDAVPAYAVFTDEELSGIAKLPQITKSNMLGIKGIGVKKVEKYGLKLQEMIQNTDK
ncbi:MAG: HRDC domain-containing protein [Mangrovibacterium sp.]